MAWYHRKTLVPPFNFGRNVKQDDWDKWFPDAPKRQNETDEEYEKRTRNEEEK